MVYLKLNFYWVFSKSESQVDLKQPKAICLLSARKTVLDTDYIGSTKYNSSRTYFNKLNFKVHIFYEGHIFLRNLHCRFVQCSNSQMYGGDFAKFCGLLRINEF